MDYFLHNLKAKIYFTSGERCFFTTKNYTIDYSTLYMNKAVKKCKKEIRKKSENSRLMMASIKSKTQRLKESLTNNHGIQNSIKKMNQNWDYALIIRYKHLNSQYIIANKTKMKKKMKKKKPN